MMDNNINRKKRRNSRRTTRNFLLPSSSLPLLVVVSFVVLASCSCTTTAAVLAAAEAVTNEEDCSSSSDGGVCYDQATDSSSGGSTTASAERRRLSKAEYDDDDADEQNNVKKGGPPKEYWGGLISNEESVESTWSDEEKERCRYDPHTTDEYLQNVWKPGDLDLVYERIVEKYVNDPNHELKIWSRPLSGASSSASAAASTTSRQEMEVDNNNNNNNVEPIDGPWIITLENFTTPEECDAMIKWAEFEIQDAGGEVDVSEDEEEEYDEDDPGSYGCRSIQAWCYEECINDPIVRGIVKRVEELVKLSWDYAEEMHFIKYVPGQEYTAHHDFLKEEIDGMHGPRLFTLYLYWNDVDDGIGGETVFPKLQGLTKARDNGKKKKKNSDDDNDTVLAIRPKRGRLLLWPNVLNDDPGAIDDRTYHEAWPVETGLKYGTTIWFHLRNHTYVNDMQCINSYPAATDDDLGSDNNDDEEHYDDEGYNDDDAGYNDDDYEGYNDDDYGYNDDDDAGYDDEEEEEVE